MPALVSTIVPVYNGERWLRAAVDSLVAQTYPEHEIILVDDGSSDGSSALVDELAAHASVRAIHQQNAGVAGARNAGISVARGDYLAFCDQDDLWLPRKLEKQLPLFNESVGLVYSGVELRLPHSTTNIIPRGAPATFESTLSGNTISCCTAIARREYVEQVGSFEVDRALMGVDDWHLWMKLLHVTESAYVPEVLAVHQMHDTNYSWRHDAMLKASLACLSSLERDPALAQRAMDMKAARLTVLEHYSRNFVHFGQFAHARKCLREMLALAPLQIRPLALLALLSTTPDVALTKMQQLKRRAGAL